MLMPSQKLLAVSRTFLAYAPIGPEDFAGGASCSAMFGHQLLVKSNLSPVSRRFFSVRRAKAATVTAAMAVSAKRIAWPSQGASCTRSIQAATKSAPAKLAGTRYFQHMFII